MFRKKKQHLEISESKLKSLKMFESVDAEYCTLGFSINYTRVPTGVIRTLINNTSISQQLIPLPASYFVI